MSGPAPGAPTRLGRRILLSGLVVLLVAGTALVLGSGLGAAGREPPLALAGRPAPALAGRTLDGDRVDLGHWRGSVVLVNVWASWCEPCRRELPLLAAAQRRLADRGLRVLAVATRDGPVAARALLAETGATSLPSLTDPDGSIAVSWGVRGVPETFLVDRDGRVRARCTGPLTGTWLREHVEPLLLPERGT